MWTPADEHAHPGVAPAGWEESWSFDFVTADERLAGFARLALHPVEGRAWWWAAVVGHGRPYVLAKEHDIVPPKPPSLEIRASGLWAEIICEEPFEHLSVGLEAFALAFDDPTDAYGAERGQPVPLGFDLGWEALSPPAALARGTTGTAAAAGYGQDCAVHGEVLVGRERLRLAGTGRRTHAWGPPQWGRTTAAVTADATADGRGLIEDPPPLYHAPVQLPGARLARALCRRPDGGLAWEEAYLA